MRGYRCSALVLQVLLLRSVLEVDAQTPEQYQHDHMKRSASQGVVADSGRLLGSGDEITVWIAEAEELNGKTFSIERSGELKLPLVGRIHAGGLTIDVFERELNQALGKFLQRPDAVVAITGVKSEPVSITGAVNSPGIYQLRGGNTLTEMLAAAGGVRQDVGSTVRITRQIRYGPLALPGATEDIANGISWGNADIQCVLSGQPDCNIVLYANDTVTVLRSGMVYVLGDVMKPGAFPLGEHQSVSLLQVLAIAGGLSKTASPSNMRIIRFLPNHERDDIQVDGKKIMRGKAKDVPLIANDILYVHDSVGKRATRRTAEAIIQSATYMLGWGLIR